MELRKVSSTLLLLVSASVAFPTTPHSKTLDMKNGVIVHMFEWRWVDIALECEQFLGPRGYKGIQISPPNENLVVNIPGKNRPWWERYQPVSYNLTTRSGSEQELADMLRRCNAAGIRVFADVVVNHMTGSSAGEACVGTAGTPCDHTEHAYPGVPYTIADFHQPLCEVNNYTNTTEVRVCQLVSLHDLNQTSEHVRDMIVGYMNHLIHLGVAGFRMDAAKHMYPSDLAVIYGRLTPLNTEHGFEPHTRAYVLQEVSPVGAVTYKTYVDIGRVTDFSYGDILGRAFLNRDNFTISKLRVLSPGKWGILPQNESLVFVDNHDTERDGDPSHINAKTPRQYKMALAYLLARGIGLCKILSSYSYVDFNDGPPSDSAGRILPPAPGPDNRCANGWLCQHRWRQIYNMVLFHNVTSGTELSSWWDNGGNQIALSMGRKGFIAFNLDSFPFKETLQTNLPEGRYCDLISGDVDMVNGRCEGRHLDVNSDGTATVHLPRTNLSAPGHGDGMLAILDGYKLPAKM